MRAAEDVREAQLNLFKGKLASIRHRKTLQANMHPGAKIERDIETWSHIPLNNIVETNSSNEE